MLLFVATKEAQFCHQELLVSGSPALAGPERRTLVPKADLQSVSQQCGKGRRSSALNFGKLVGVVPRPEE